MNTRTKPTGTTIRPLLSLAALGAAALLFAGCNSGDGPSVKTDYDKNVNFAQYHTFAFQPGRLVSRLGTPDTNNTLVAGRIQNAVVNQLTAKGLQPVTQNPDLVATYVAGAKTKQDIESMGPDPYDSPYFGGRFGLTEAPISGRATISSTPTPTRRGR